MGISLKSEHLTRYKDIAWLFMKYGRSDLVKLSGLEEAIDEEANPVAAASVPEAEELASDLEKMGPTFIKLAQLLSTRADLLPMPYLEALTRLQDKVEPFSYEEVERAIQAELGVRLSKVFPEFDPVPVAAASLGQVHRATTRDGRAVVVKVQRPGVREQIIGDLEVLEDVAAFLDRHTEMGKRYEFQPMLAQLRKSLMRELDYRQEARHLITLGENLKDFDLIVVPHPIEYYTTSRVLTMDYIQGRKITALSPLAQLELDGADLAEHFFHAYLKQILIDGLFHADPHPGNVFLTEDNRIALIDLGMIGRLSPRMQENLLQLLLAISEGRGDEPADLTIRMGQLKEDFDESPFTRHIADLVVQHQDASLSNIDAGRVVLEITRIAGERGFRLPPEFTMIAKTLLNLDQVVHTLDPDFDPNASIRSHATEIMQQRLMRTLSAGNLYNTALEMKGLIEKLPARINNFLDAVANNELQLKVDAINETRLMEGLQKIANRITLGLVLAALIIGAALMMRVETSFKLFGYPGLAIIFFLIAAGGALVLAYNILFHDEKADKKSDSD